MTRRWRRILRGVLVAMTLLTGEVRAAEYADFPRPTDHIADVATPRAAPSVAARRSSTTTTTTTTAPPPHLPGSTEAAPAPSEPNSGLVGRAAEALASTVPGPWLATVSPQLYLIEGVTSLSSAEGWIKVSRHHASGAWPRLRAVMAHEWAHQVAFRYGTQAYLGAPPAGWPYHGAQPAEAWSHCTAFVLTGIDLDPGDAGCSPPAVEWIRHWLADGPP